MRGRSGWVPPVSAAPFQCPCAKHGHHHDCSLQRALKNHWEGEPCGVCVECVCEVSECGVCVWSEVCVCAAPFPGSHSVICCLQCPTRRGPQNEATFVCVYVMIAPNLGELSATDRGNTMSVTALLWQEPIREELKLSYSNWYICAVAVPTKNCRADRVSMCVCLCVCVCVRPIPGCRCP